MRNAVGAALSGVALFVSGCAGDSQAQVGDSTSPSLGSADTLVLRTMTTGGFAGLGGPGTVPDFSLYGDGRAVTGGREPTEYHLTHQALRRLVSDASKAGLATPRTVDDPNISDGTYKVITFVTGGRARTTKVIQEGGRADDPAKKFLARLVPANWPRGDQASAPVAYRPSRVAVLAVASPGSGPKWPYGPLTSGKRVGTSGCTVLTGADAAKAQRLATARTQWNDRGKSFRVRIRPLLPDERDCAALSR
ncbi:hypothetical protein GCM10027176_80660 [Actinoallomurus bryophytorum]|uniref:Secreted protein n=1 Tax=Actinoallomurus bryophytorum TaxID=1490222 RepID=A0A543CF38_9ACTN|nr:hypothetical protein [Actinoallomurus bryophytorum]TQL95537.1 hypothetical protein FB559_1040 [Actinoallomurus bryophytorum]